MSRARVVGLFFWALHASLEVALGTERHPLCRTLEGHSHHPHRANEFPTQYSCRGVEDGEPVPCYSTTTVVAETERHAAESSSAWSMWLVCEGTRERESDRGIEGRSLIDCEGYFAVSGKVENPIEFCRSLNRNSHQGASQPVAPARGLASSSSSSSSSSTELISEELVPNEEVPAGAAPEQKPVDATTDLAVDDYAGSVGGDVLGGADKFVHTRGDEEGCSEAWASWPAVHEAAVRKGTVLMFDLFPSVGNIFVVLSNLMKVARLLEVAVVLNWKAFEGFRVAFDPADIMWDMDPTSVGRKAERIARVGSERLGLHSLKFSDGLMILDGAQLELLALEMGIAGKHADETAVSVQESYPNRMRSLLLDLGRTLPAVPPCGWNMLLRRSPSMIESLAAHSPWTHSDGRPEDYVAWHIRTSDGESARSFKPDVHTYVFHRQSSNDVCPLYLAATVEVEAACQDLFPGGVQAMPIFISSNSKSMSRNCTSDAAGSMVTAGFVDLGIADSDAHTNFSKDPKLTAVSAFIDYLFLMDAAMIVRTRSSFSGTAAKIKGLDCQAVPAGEDQAVNGLTMCMPRGC